MDEAENGVAPEADDLFSRWLAHHNQQTSADEQTLAEESAGRAPSPVTVPDSRSTDMEREVPGFEPVIMPSVRKHIERSREPRRGLLRSRGRTDDDTTATSPPTDVSWGLPTPAPVAPVTPPVTRRLNRSVSGDEPDWLKELRAAASADDARPDPPPAAPAAPADQAQVVEAPADEAPEVEPEVEVDEAPVDEAPVVEPEVEPDVEVDEAPEVEIEAVDEVGLEETDDAADDAADDPAEEPVEEPDDVTEEPEHQDDEPTDSPAVVDEADEPGTAAWIARLRDGAPMPAAGAAASAPSPATMAEPVPEIDWRARFRDDPPTATDATEPDATRPDATTAPPAARPESAAQPAAEPAAETTRTRITPLTSMPEVYRFKPRRATRVLVTAVFVLGLAGSAYLLWQAYLDPDQTNIVMMASAAFATAVLWAIRATTTLTRLSVRGGQLEVVRDGTRSVFDLTSASTPIELRGTPGKRGWRARFVRRGMPPFDVDSSIVDPVEFCRVLRYHRPEDSDTTDADTGTTDSGKAPPA